ncbi:unnamed protein product, partial [marine sediment metagenome]
STLTLRSTSGVGTTGADIIFQVGNNGATEAMRILNSGNVGIGTTEPGVTASYTGTVLTVGAGETGLVSAVEIYGQRTGDDGTIGADLTFLNASATGDDKRVGIIRGLRLGDDNSGGLRFYSRNAGSFVQAATIDSSGNVGIGTPLPTASLHVPGPNVGTDKTAIRVGVDNPLNLPLGEWARIDVGLKKSVDAFATGGIRVQVIHDVSESSFPVGIQVRGEIAANNSNSYLHGFHAGLTLNSGANSSIVGFESEGENLGSLPAWPPNLGWGNPNV